MFKSMTEINKLKIFLMFLVIAIGGTVLIFLLVDFKSCPLSKVRSSFKILKFSLSSWVDKYRNTPLVEREFIFTLSLP